MKLRSGLIAATNNAVIAAETAGTAVEDTMAAPLQQEAQALQLAFATWSNSPTADNIGAL